MKPKIKILTLLIITALSSSLIACVCFGIFSLSGCLAAIIAILSSIAIAFVVYIFVPKNNPDEKYPQKSDNDVVAIIAHELRSPITSIKGYLSAMNDGIIEPSQQKKYIGIAIDESDRAVSMLENLMSLSKFDSGNINLKPEDFDVNELIRLVIIEKINDIEAKNINIETVFDNEKAIAFADKNLIRQVIINLADNAIKYNNQNGNIRFETHFENGKINISVIDNGIGIESDALPHVWDRFYQADATAQTFYKGHGLGLCIVKEIIKAHHEDISVKSSINFGSSFSFTLPIADNINGDK